MSEDWKVSEKPKIFNVNIAEVDGKTVAFITHHLPDDADKAEVEMCDNIGKIMVGVYNAIVDGNVAFAEEVAAVVVNAARAVSGASKVEVPRE